MKADDSLFSFVDSCVDGVCYALCSCRLCLDSHCEPVPQAALRIAEVLLSIGPVSCQEQIGRSTSICPYRQYDVR